MTYITNKYVYQINVSDDTSLHTKRQNESYVHEITPHGHHNQAALQNMSLQVSNVSIGILMH